MIVYLDMDGVAVDCHTGLEKAFNVTLPKNLGHEADTYISQQKGISKAEFWSSLGEDFWENLEPLPWFNRLYETCCRIGPTYFCTSPTMSPSCHSGKVKWLQKHLGKYFRNYMLIRDKFLLSRKDTMLIDDYPLNIIKFYMHGDGLGLLFPCDNNPSNHAYGRDIFLDLLEQFSNGKISQETLVSQILLTKENHV